MPAHLFPMLISPEYRALNRALHSSDETYGAHGHKAAPAIRKIAQDNGFSCILDYGCGKGSLKQALSEFDVREFDPAIDGKDAEPTRADLVACLDVLEHIEPDCLDDVLKHIRSVTGHLLVVSVATIPSSKTLDDGRNAHLIVQPPEWWLAKLSEQFRILSWRVDRSHVVCVAKERA